MNTAALSGLAKLTAAFVVGWLYLHGYGQGPTGLLTQAKASLSNAPAFKPPGFSALPTPANAHLGGK